MPLCQNAKAWSSTQHSAHVNTSTWLMHAKINTSMLRIFVTACHSLVKIVKPSKLAHRDASGIQHWHIETWRQQPCTPTPA
jgi:hypothetical protein